MARDDREHLRAAFEIACRARRHGNHPFGAVLVDSADGRILEAENTVVTEHDSTGHAETNLMRAASHILSADALSRCTIYTSAEPCAMCAGAIYWANVRRVVFGLSQRELYVITGGEPHERLLRVRYHSIEGQTEATQCVVPPQDLVGNGPAAGLCHRIPAAATTARPHLHGRAAASGRRPVLPGTAGFAAQRPRYAEHPMRDRSRQACPHGEDV